MSTRPGRHRRPNPSVVAARAAAAVVIAMVAVVAMMIATQVIITRFLPQSSAVYLSATLTLALIYHLVGGGIGATIARGSRAAGLALVVAGGLMMLGSVRNTWASVPPWYSMAMMAIAPAGLAFGYRAYARRVAEG